MTIEKSECIDCKYYAIIICKKAYLFLSHSRKTFINHVGCKSKVIK
jgi:hypothetical protein